METNHQDTKHMLDFLKFITALCILILMMLTYITFHSFTGGDTFKSSVLPEYYNYCSSGTHMICQPNRNPNINSVGFVPYYTCGCVADTVEPASQQEPLR
jgi:hypothetical protein